MIHVSYLLVVYVLRRLFTGIILYIQSCSKLSAIASEGLAENI